MSPDFWLRASEVQAYTYCARSWWLQHELGLEPENQEALADGTTRHLYDGHRVVRSTRLGRLGAIILFAAVLLFVLAWLLGGG